MKIGAAAKLVKAIASQDPTRGYPETMGHGVAEYICRFCRASDLKVERIEHAPTCEWRQAREIIHPAA